MDYRRFGDKIVARIDPGEEIHEQLEKIALREGVVGVYKVAEKQYFANSFQGPFEIVSLTGTISTKDGAYYAHLHMSAGNEKGEVFGGHLNRARVSATCEMVISIIDGTVERRFDPEIGLNLFEMTE